jgi:hypothetical protein
MCRKSVFIAVKGKNNIMYTISNKCIIIFGYKIHCHNNKLQLTIIIYNINAVSRIFIYWKILLSILKLNFKYIFIYYIIITR